MEPPPAPRIRTTLPPALAGLVHPDKDVRQQAAVSLGERADPQLAPAIAQLLWRESDFFVRETLTWALTRTPAAATRAAAEALQQPDPGVRSQALHVLSKIGDPDSAALVATLLDDECASVVHKARWTLARIGDPSVVPALVSRLGEPDLESRDGMTSTLAEFGQAAVAPLIAALGHAHPDVRTHAADVLCHIGFPAARESVDALLDCLADENADVRLAAVLALHALAAHPEALEALNRASTTHADPRVRGVAARATPRSTTGGVA